MYLFYTMKKQTEECFKVAQNSNISVKSLAVTRTSAWDIARGREITREI